MTREDFIERLKNLCLTACDSEDESLGEAGVVDIVNELSSEIQNAYERNQSYRIVGVYDEPPPTVRGAIGGFEDPTY